MSEEVECTVIAAMSSAAQADIVADIRVKVRAYIREAGLTMPQSSLLGVLVAEIVASTMKRSIAMASDVIKDAARQVAAEGSE